MESRSTLHGNVDKSIDIFAVYKYNKIELCFNEELKYAFTIW